MGTIGSMNGSDTGGSVPAFNRGRWESVLRSMDINFGTDDEGDNFGDWEGARVWFEAKGAQSEILVIRVVLDARPPLEAYEKVALLANEWNAEHLWPRAYVIRTPQECVLIGDLVQDLETGATDEYLRQQVRCGLSTAFEFIGHLAQAIPESSTWRHVGRE